MSRSQLNISFRSYHLLKLVSLFIVVVIFLTSTPATHSRELSEKPIVDIMVVYTPAVRQAAGSTQAIESIIGLAIDETNTIYRDSQVNGVLRLVHSEEINYTEIGQAGADLDTFYKNNSYIDTLRERYGADLVSLFIKGKDGAAYLLQSKQQQAPFSAMDYLGAVSFYVFAHETGHNMGLCHDTVNNNSCIKSDPSFYPYANGYNDPQGTFSDIMSNAGGNSSCPGKGSCPRAPFFSNPNINFNGRPIGLLNSADNVRALNETMSIVAQWEPAKIIPSIYLPMIYASNISPNDTQITRLDTSSGPAISEISITPLSASRFIIIGRNSNGTLILTSWELTSSGKLRMVSSISGFNAKKLKIASLSTNRFVTVATDISDNVGINVWNVLENGQISPVSGSGIGGRKSNDVAISVLGDDHFVTIEQITSGDFAGRTNIAPWNVSPDGKLQASGGVLAYNNTNGVEAITAKDNKIFLVSQRPDNSGLQLEMWTVTKDNQFIGGGSRQSNIASYIAAVSPDSAHVITATRNNQGNLELTTWDIASQVFGRKTDITSTNIATTRVAVSQLSTNRVATALRDNNGNTKIIIWGGIQSGGFRNLGSANSGSLSTTSDIRVASLGGNRLVVVGQKSDGFTEISAWNVTN